MFNPLVDDFSALNDSEIEEKISELGRKFFQSHNPHVQTQIATLLEMYKEEMRSRRAKQYLQNLENNNSDLDSLIKVR